MKKWFVSQEGSTLVMAVMIISVLSIFGIALLSLAAFNVKVRLIDQRTKSSFYSAEAGIEEAYGVVAKKVEEASEDSKKKAKDKIDEVVKEKKNAYYDYLEEEHPTASDQLAYMQYTYDVNSKTYFIMKENGEVDEEGVKTFLEDVFKQNFREYMDSDEDKGLFTTLASHTFGTSLIDSAKEIKVEIINDIHKKKFSEGGDSNISTCYLQSTYKTKDTLTEEQRKSVINKINKTVKAKFQVKIPSYDQPFYVQNKVVKLNDNILLNKAFTTEGNIIVKSNVQVTGDIYAYGEQNISPDLARSETFDGIVVGKDGVNGTLNITGNIATNSYVHIQSSSGTNGSSINVDGNIYSNSLSIEEDTDGATIHITGDAYTKDDIELNGNHATINIDRDYYGFSDGTTHDQSSSIAVNSEDIGETNGSLLNIAGKAFIGGTAYIHTEPEQYQTGESVSIKGNYAAYGVPLSISDLEHIKESNETYDVDSHKKYLEEHVDFHEYSPLVLASQYDSEYNDPDENHTANYAPFTVIDKSNYFYDVAHKQNPEEYDLSLKQQGVTINDIIFSIGTSAKNGEIQDAVPLQTYEVNNTSLPVEIVRRYLGGIYNYYINKFGDKKDKNILDSLVNGDGTIHENNNEELSQQDQIFEGSNARFSFDQFSSLYQTIHYNKEYINNNPIDTGIAYTENELKNEPFIFINPEENTSILIVGPGGNIPTDLDAHTLIYDFSSLSQDDFELCGMIVTQGKVYFRGMVNFEGNVIAKGDIILEDSSDKTFVNDSNSKQYIYQKLTEIATIEDTNRLIEAFRKNWDESYTVIASNTAADQTMQSYKSFKDIIEITDWEKQK